MGNSLDVIHVAPGTAELWHDETTYQCIVAMHAGSKIPRTRPVRRIIVMSGRARSGHRCVLEKDIAADGSRWYETQGCHESPVASPSQWHGASREVFTTHFEHAPRTRIVRASRI